MRKTKKKSKQRSNRLKRIAKRLAAYSAAAAATVVASQDRSADATERVHDIPDVAISGMGIQFNVISGATAAATKLYSYGAPVEGSFRVGSAFFEGFLELAGPFNSSGAGFVGSGGFVSTYFYPNVLGASSSVSAGKAFGGRNDFLSYGIYGFLSNFVDTRGFVGLQFDIGGNTHYGWADISGVGGGQTLHAFGYNDAPGAASHVPEPNALMLLASGAVGLGMLRRRRKGGEAA